MDEWYYTSPVEGQRGPVTGDALLGLNNRGEIDAETLVWRDGMADWAPFSTVASPLFGAEGDDTPVETGVCAHSKRVYPLSEMIPYGDALIGVEHKEAFVQKLMETGETGIADATDRPLEYVGFWWRVLGSILDYLVKMVPSSLCMVPYYIVAAMSGVSMEDDDMTLGWGIAMGAAYGFGLLAMGAISIYYETWMVGKYQGTVGKLVIGAKVVNPDGTRLTYKRAFVRWLAKIPLNYLIVYVPPMIVLVLVIALGVGAFAGGDRPALVATTVIGSIVAYLLVSLLCAGVYWMAAFDPEKRALHDRVAGTRVAKR